MGVAMARSRKSKASKIPLGPIAQFEAKKRLDRAQSTLDVITPEQRAKGTYDQGRRIHNSSLLDKWFDEQHVGFHEGSRLAIEWCHKRWEARGIIGHMAASYEPSIGGGQSSYDRDVSMRDELDVMKAMFPEAYWDVFEGVVRWGRPAGIAGSELADNPPQAIASARAVVGMIASFIAMKRGY